MERIASDMENPLDRYKRDRALTDQELADMFGFERSLVTRLRRGTRKPSLQAALRIAERTNGEIPPDAWRRQ